MNLEFKKKFILFYHKHFIRRPKNLIGASLCRFAYGIWLLTFYLQSFTIRHFIWGNQGPVTHEEFLNGLAFSRGFSLLTFSADPRFIDAMVILGLLSGISVTLGLFTRLSIIISTILIWSFHLRNGWILDGGDNIGRIVLMFMIFMNCSAHFSLDSRFGKIKKTSPGANIIHNVLLFGLTIQFSLLFLNSYLAKIAGPLWQNGTAVYYVFKNNVFSNPNWRTVLSQHYGLVTFATYSVLVLQGSFAYLIWSKTFKIPIILGLMMFHAATGYLMGLVHFTNAMIGGLLLFIPDKSYRKFGHFVIELYRSFAMYLKRLAWTSRRSP